MDTRQIFEKTTSGPWITEPTTDTQYRIEETDGTLIIFFQGSVSDMDWRQNFMFWKKPYKRMSNILFVHAGFLKKWKSVRKVITDSIISAASNGKQIKIRAYSQGAGVGMLCHEAVYFHTGNSPETILFGCPRVFSIFGYSELNYRMRGVIRYQNGNDSVTKVPFWWMLYKHYGKEWNIGSKRKWWKFSVEDHLPKSYKESLEL